MAGWGKSWAIVLAALAAADPRLSPAGPSGKRGGKPEAPSAEIPFGEPYALGVLGAKGFVRKDHILVSEVGPESPAGAAGILQGDRIVALSAAGETIEFGGTAPDETPLTRLVSQLTRAASKGKTVELRLERGSGSLKVKVKPERLKAHSASCPRRCVRCDAIVEEALAHLAKGAGRSAHLVKETIVSSVAGLAFMGEGSTPTEGKYAEPLRRCLRSVAGGVLSAGAQRDGGFGNWALGIGGLFLAEACARFGDIDLSFPAGTEPAPLDREPQPPGEEAPRVSLFGVAAQVARQIAAQQESSGGWGHGGMLGTPNSLNYIEVQACGNWCLAALGRMRQAGVPVPKEAWEKGVAYARSCNAGGGICYSAAKKYAPQIGRTSATYLAFWCGSLHEDRMAGEMRGFIRKSMERMPEGHATPSMHFLACGLGAACDGLQSDLWRDFWEEYVPKMESLRGPEGTFALWPSDVGNDKRFNGRVPERDLPSDWPTAVHALLLQLPKGNLLQPAPKRRKEPKKPQAPKPR